MRYPTKGTRATSIYDWIATTVCEESASPPAYFGCLTADPSASPSVAPVDPVVVSAPPSVAPVTISITASPSSEPSPQPVTTPSPVATTSSPSAEPSVNPFTLDCLDRGQFCQSSLDCCSGRCLLNECRTYFQPVRQSLRGDRGGAAARAVDISQTRGTPQGFGFDDP